MAQPISVSAATVEAPLGVRLPRKGGVLPLLVKPDGSKAVIDQNDPRINSHALIKADKQAGKDCFDSQLREPPQHLTANGHELAVLPYGRVATGGRGPIYLANWRS